jgi:FkbM family methyltransferase
MPENIKHFILWAVSQLCRLPLKNNWRLSLQDKFYFKLRPNNTIVTLKVGRIKVLVDLKEFMLRLMYFQAYERIIIKFLKSYVQPGWICIDVGANVGYISAILADRVGNNGKVFSLEPNPCVFTHLQSVVKSSSGIVQSYKLAASNMPGNVAFYSNKNVTALSTFIATLKPAESQSISVEAVTIDDFCNSKSIKPNFIKIDVEGAEPFVICGMTKLLATGCRPSLLCEFKPWTYSDPKKTCSELLGIFDGLGYEILEFTSDDQLRPLNASDLSQRVSDVNALLLSPVR